MDTNEYLHDRLEQQIRWYSEKSGSAQQIYKRLKIGEFLLSAAIPLISLILWDCIYARYIMSGIGSILSVLAYVHGLYKWHDHWIMYRSTAEALKREKYLYLAKAGPYVSPDADRLLVTRCEQILSQENALWAVMHDEETKHKG